MKGTVFTKTIICVFILLLIQAQVCANPIPVFLFFGWIQKQNVSSSIYEREYGTDRNLKRYVKLGSDIYEREYGTDRNLKRYVKFGSDIYEREYGTDRNLKRYTLY